MAMENTTLRFGGQAAACGITSTALTEHSAAITFGTNGDVPAPGDIDGDGKLDDVVFRPSTGVWYVLRSTDLGFPAVQWGLNGDVPAIGDYDGDGREDIAVFRPSNGVWFMRRTADGGLQAGQFGQNGDLPVPKYDAP